MPEDIRANILNKRNLMKPQGASRSMPTFKTVDVVMFHLFLLAMVAVFWSQGAVAVNILPNAIQLLSNQYLNNSDYSLVLDGNCNLILYYQRSLILWQTNTTSETACMLLMQTDGNLVLYNTTTDQTPSTAVWASQNSHDTSGPYFFLLQSSGTMSIYRFEKNTLNPSPYLYNSSISVSGSAVAPSANPLDANLTPPTLNASIIPYMPAGYNLQQGSSLKNGNFTLTLGDDCVLHVTNQSGVVFWNSGNAKCVGPCQLTLQQDGILQIESTNGNSNDWIWKSNCTSPDPSRNWIFYLDPLGGVSIIDILDHNASIWSTGDGGVQGTCPPRRFSLIMLLLGAVGGVLLLGVTTLALMSYRRARTIDPMKKELQQQLQKYGRELQELSLPNIRKATKGFGTKIGAGGFGDVFYGKLANEQEIAVKMLSASSGQTTQEFFNEIVLFSMVHHKSLVSLIGYCLTHQILVYEYMSGGNLHSKLKGESATDNPLSWEQRTKIISQIAEGLEYLHIKCVPQIIHRDIKCTNILLTENLDAKVADFGLSKLRKIDQEGSTHITTVVKGTPGYLDPEYHELGTVTVKSDVYAFGIVLMQILTAEDHYQLRQKVHKACKSDQLDGLADPNLKGVFDRHEFLALAKLSLHCVKKRSTNRPSMTQVLQAFQDIASTHNSKPGVDEADLDYDEYIKSSVDFTQEIYL